MVASSLEHCLEARASLSIGERDRQQSSFKLFRQILLHPCSIICKRIQLSASVGVLYAVRNRKVCSRRGVMAHALLEPINVISGRRGWEIEECFLSVAGDQYSNTQKHPRCWICGVLIVSHCYRTRGGGGLLDRSIGIERLRGESKSDVRKFVHRNKDSFLQRG